MMQLLELPKDGLLVEGLLILGHGGS